MIESFPAHPGADYYRITVQGQLDESWSERLGDLKIANRVRGGTPIVTLAGALRDQAALLGVLNQLYNLKLPLLHVERLASQQATSKGE